MNKTERIVDAARKRFRYYGLTKTTMHEIARDAGVAVGTLYLYFRNKDELVAACAEEFVEAHRRKIAAILASGKPADRMLREYVLDRFRRSAETRTGSRHAAEITRAVLRVKPDRVEHEGPMICETVRQILEIGVEQGIFHVPNPADDAQVYLFSIAYFFPNALSELPIPARQEDLLTVTDWFIGVWKGKHAAARRRRRTSAAGGVSVRSKSR
jgi:AcrR family transcriptional regulator